MKRLCLQIIDRNAMDHSHPGYQTLQLTSITLPYARAWIRECPRQLKRRTLLQPGLPQRFLKLALNPRRPAFLDPLLFTAPVVNHSLSVRGTRAKAQVARGHASLNMVVPRAGKTNLDRLQTRPRKAPTKNLPLTLL